MSQGGVGPPTPRSRVWAVLTVAVIAVSFAAVFIRWADAPGVVVAFFRMALASAIMAPLTMRGLKRTPLTRPAAVASLWAGAALAVHFAAWISSLSYTTVAASVSLVATTPLWVMAFAWLFQRNAPSLPALIGVLVAVAGAVLVGVADAGGVVDAGGAAAASSQPLLGDLLALLGAAAGGAYLLLGRRAQRQGLGLEAYVGVAYGVAAVVLLPVPLILGVPYFAYPLTTFGAVALLALVPQLVGHTGVNYAAKHLDPAVVAAALLLEPIGAGLLAFLLFAEVPSALTALGALLLLAGVALTLRAPPRAHARRAVRPS